MDLTTITAAQFKARFVRDFNYALPSDPDYISDQDITNGFADAQFLINQSLFGTDANITLAYLYLTAHCICNNLRAAAAGVWAAAALPIAASGMGAANESYAIPEAYTKSPIYAQYLQTSYGLKYLQMAMPNLMGNMVGVFGGTNP